MRESVFEPADCFDSMIERLDREEQARQDVGSFTGKALKLAKKAIFALQRRGDAADAQQLLENALAVLVELDRSYGQTKTRMTSGQWRVAVEEYLEALFSCVSSRANLSRAPTTSFYPMTREGTENSFTSKTRRFSVRSRTSRARSTARCNSGFPTPITPEPSWPTAPLPR